MSRFKLFLVTSWVLGLAGCTAPPPAAPVVPTAEVADVPAAEPTRTILRGQSPEPPQPVPARSQGERADRASGDPPELLEDSFESLPPVLLSAREQAACRVGVGDVFPVNEVTNLAGENVKPQDLSGKRATVVCLWSNKRLMARTMSEDIAEEFAPEFAPRGVRFLAVRVGEEALALPKTAENVTSLQDERRSLADKLGSDYWPRVYVITPRGKIAWFDIEYSRSTRRELRQVLEFYAAKAAQNSQE